MPRKAAGSLKSTGGKPPQGEMTRKSKKAKKDKKDKKYGKVKSRRWRPGTVALREIFKLQKTSKLLLQKAPFQRLVREAMGAHKTGLCFKPSALEAVQEASEGYMVGLFQAAVMMQIHRKKQTLNHLDLSMARRIRGELNGK